MRTIIKNINDYVSDSPLKWCRDIVKFHLESKSKLRGLQMVITKIMDWILDMVKL